MVGLLCFPALIIELTLKEGVESDNKDVVTPKKPATSMKRVRGYSLVGEEDFPTTATTPETQV